MNTENNTSKIYNLEDHQGWGNKLTMRSQTTLSGCMTPKPKAGDFLTTIQDGRFFKWEFIKITPMGDPVDGFHADLKRIE